MTAIANAEIVNPFVDYVLKKAITEAEIDQFIDKLLQKYPYIHNFYIDLFCGAGGTTTGVEKAKVNGKKVAKVVWCINHDQLAIESHFANHPDCIHSIEDIRKFKLAPLVYLVKGLREKVPHCIIQLWASLECTNFSKAKGGLPRNADSRTLANDLLRYIKAIKPDCLWIENVEEFMSWGPLDENGKPISKNNGIDYVRWINSIKKLGYDFDHRLLNSADFGAYTSRVRYFAQFVRIGLPIRWPSPTHSKKAEETMFSSLQKWKPVKEVLDFSDEGQSIFTPGKIRSEKTFERIYAGLIKYVAGGKEAFIKKYNSNNAKTGINSGADIDNPCPVVTTQNRLGVVRVSFLSKYYSGKPEHKNIPVTGPCSTITSFGGPALVSTMFLQKYYSNGGNLSGVNEPCGGIPTKDRFALVKPCFYWLDKKYSGSHNHQSIEKPSGVILSNDKHGLVKCERWIMNHSFKNAGSGLNTPCPTLLASRRHYYLMNPQYNSNGSSIDKPCFTLIARMDKKPPYLIATESGLIGIEVYNTDSPAVKLIKEFMALYGIVDIKMRMLKVPELLRIQGFPEGYILKGNQTDQKKYIGNSVPPEMSENTTISNYLGFLDHFKIAA